MTEHSTMRTDWFHRARWGASSHYLADFASNTAAIDLAADEWNRQIDAFDVEGLARNASLPPHLDLATQYCFAGS